MGQFGNHSGSLVPFRVVILLLLRHSRPKAVPMTTPHVAHKASRQRFTVEDPGYYLGKFQRRLYRQMVQYQTLRDHAKGTLEKSGETIATSLGLAADSVRFTEIRDHAEKSCLVGLKVEFELFMYIICHLVLDGTLRHVANTGHLGSRQKRLTDLIGRKKEFYDRLVEGGLQNASDLFIEMAVPDYGLPRMRDLLGKCGIGDDLKLAAEDLAFFDASLPDTLKGCVEPWAQIQTAFQVRHAIEHSFSRVNPDFLRKAGAVWPKSSWARHFSEVVGPKNGQRLTLDPTDVYVTASAMAAVGRKLVSIASNLDEYLT